MPVNGFQLDVADLAEPGFEQCCSDANGSWICDIPNVCGETDCYLYSPVIECAGSPGTYIRARIVLTCNAGLDQLNVFAYLIKSSSASSWCGSAPFVNPLLVYSLTVSYAAGCSQFSNTSLTYNSTNGYVCDRTLATFKLTSLT